VTSGWIKELMRDVGYVVQGLVTSGQEEDARQACMHLPRSAVFVNWKRPV
jgi:hypothetical protein